MAEWLRRWTRNPMGSSRAGSIPAHSETFLCKKKQLWKESMASSGRHWNDEVEHSALNLFAPAAMAKRLRRWTRNPMGSSRAGSNPARSEIIFVLKKEIQLWKGSHPSSSSHWNDEVEHSALNLNAPAAMGELLKSKSKGIFPPRFESCSQRDLFVLQRTSFGKKALRQVVPLKRRGWT